MSAEIIPFPVSRQVREPLLPKKNLAATLGYSIRWVEIKTKAGMPAHRTPNGQRRYRLSEVLAWLDERKAS